jgi:hypothetical protein
MSRRLALVLGYVNPEAARRLRAAAEGHTVLDDVALPYREWLRDVRTIPMADRARYVDSDTGQVVVREIVANI